MVVYGAGDRGFDCSDCGALRCPRVVVVPDLGGFFLVLCFAQDTTFVSLFSVFAAYFLFFLQLIFFTVLLRSILTPICNR